METKTGTTQEFNRFPFARDLHEIQPVFPEADFGLGITSGLPVTRSPSRNGLASGFWGERSRARKSAAACLSSDDYGVNLVLSRG